MVILIAIPVTLFFVKQQQQLKSKATAASTLYFGQSPNSTATASANCATFTMDLTIDPGSNVVSTVEPYLTYDPTKVQITGVTPSQAFPSFFTNPELGNGTAHFSVSTPANQANGVTAPTKVATITLKPLAAGAATLTIDQSQSRVFAFGSCVPGNSQCTENVLASATPGNINISNDACTTGSNTNGTGTTNNTNNTGTTNNTNGTTNTTNQTGSTNTNNTTTSTLAPICTTLSVSPNATGSAPMPVLFTGSGSDPNTNGLITKATFSFGDGQVQDVTTGLSQKAVTTQTNHTYNNAGTFSATLVFTNNGGAVSNACAQTITASGSGNLAAVTTPIPTATPIPTVAPTVAPATPTPIPTVAPTGSFGATIGIGLTVLVTIIGGFLLLAL